MQMPLRLPGMEIVMQEYLVLMPLFSRSSLPASPNGDGCLVIAEAVYVCRDAGDHPQPNPSFCRSSQKVAKGPA